MPDYIVIHKIDEKKPLMTLMTLKALEKQLPYDRFSNFSPTSPLS